MKNSKAGYLSFLVLAGALLLFLGSCKPNDSARPDSIEGYAPIYANLDSVNIIYSEAPRTIVNGGKIYVKDQTFYQVENGEGIHVIDISNPEQPQKLKFIRVFGIQEMSIKNNLLYANNHNDLVTLNIANLNNVTVLNRVGNAFHLYNSERPPSEGWFECVEPSKGTVVSWKLKTLTKPNCRY